MTQLKFKSTVDVTLVQSMGGDHMVVAAAKVATTGTDAMAFACEGSAVDNFGLINYLMKHRHGTPFEHGAVTFFVHAPIFVWREWHRHRIGFSYNEESGRYKQLEPCFYLPDRERPMMKVDGWKPGRPKFTRCENEDTYDRLLQNLRRSYSVSYDSYEENLAMGIDPGLARDCLPVGIYSGCWVTCNPRSLMAFLSLRTCEPEAAKFVSYPLWEIKLAARACERMYAEADPLTHKAWQENVRVAP
jgi:thymidylate synthase (FAD)